MTVSILRSADAWWVQNPTGAAQVTTTATTTRELLADRAAIEAAAHSSDTVPVDSLQLLSPITTPCRVVAQLTNYASHVKDAGRDPATTPLAFFRKASGSISGPLDDTLVGGVPVRRRGAHPATGHRRGTGPPLTAAPLAPDCPGGPNRGRSRCNPASAGP